MRQTKYEFAGRKAAAWFLIITRVVLITASLILVWRAAFTTPDGVMARDAFLAVVGLLVLIATKP